MAERGTSVEGGDNRLGCHASVAMLWLEESAQGKQGGNPDDNCKFLVFVFFVRFGLVFLLNVSLKFPFKLPAGV